MELLSDRLCATSSICARAILNSTTKTIIFGCTQAEGVALRQ